MSQSLSDRRRWVGIALVALLATWIVLPAPRGQAAPASVATPIRFSTAFIQPYAATNWTVAQWTQHLSILAAAGHTRLIWNWSAEARLKETLYPTTIPGWTKSTEYAGTEIANLLTAADAIGFQVWLGLVFDEDYYDFHADDPVRFHNLHADDRAVASELNTLYGSHPSFTGFYEANETENCNYQSATAAATVASAFKLTVDHIHAMPGSKTLAHAPAVWPEWWCATNPTPAANQSAWGTTWNTILSQANLDYLIVQDGLGGRFHTNTEIIQWFQFMRSVVDGHPATFLGRYRDLQRDQLQSLVGRTDADQGCRGACDAAGSLRGRHDQFLLRPLRHADVAP